MRATTACRRFNEKNTSTLLNWEARICNDESVYDDEEGGEEEDAIALFVRNKHPSTYVNDP